MDEYDRKILAQLQADGRLSLTDLSERIGLSLSPCHRRVKALEDAGVIRAYQAQVDPGKVGLEFSAIVFVTLKEANKQTVSAFERSVLNVAEVIQAQRLFGDPDYILRVVTSDLRTYQDLYDEQLSSLPGVLRLNSTLVMKTVIQDRPLPI
ncbi:DNA-binding transcriptional regulator, Lrp family [Devosia sp. YR412]|uniref:Lrp/AsnC family transcriptional regulator n=1 Tax=Devosia sp. YR412 TaxID=1881030 RepID=UPI0008D1986B|nr:Lrp/AsnC family transcriptional regulator [Devosia sp. YR412]SEQ10570.1 DNA-binding transcriptional regulator, Lrp family [Devosia sp. YR412]